MKEYRIVNGPSKFTLFNTFPDKVDGHRRPVTFAIKASPEGAKWSEIHVVVNTIAWEDGSGESWCFDGYVTRYGWLPQSVHGHSVKGYFRTDKRNCGWLKIVGDLPPLN